MTKRIEANIYLFFPIMKLKQKNLKTVFLQNKSALYQPFPLTPSIDEFIKRGGNN